MVFLEILKAILETVKVFLIDFGNPIRALVESLIGLIVDLFETLKRTGLFGYYDLPNPLIDPNFDRHYGGYQAFVARFKNSLVDNRDPNRPQPSAGATKSGFTLIVADAEAATGLVKLIKVLLSFFGKEFLQPQYGVPANVKVLPLGDDGDPILSIAKLFQDEPTSFVVSWALPPTGRPGDPGFSDLVQSFSTDFYPPKFLIEKSSKDVSGEMDIGDLNSDDAVGQVTAVVPTSFEVRGQPGVVVDQKVKLFDEYDDPFIRFEKYIVIDLANAPTTFVLGQLGTFRWIDDDVEPNKTYFYRVRAFSGDLAVDDESLIFPSVEPSTNVVENRPLITWPGTDPAAPPVMGRASPVIRARLPKFVEDFDVLETLNRTFQVGYSLNFHQPQDPDAKFDATGQPIEPTVASDVGVGTMDDIAGSLAAFEAIPVIGDAVSGFLAPDPVTGKGGELPWQQTLVQRNSIRLSNAVAGALLEAGGAEGLKDFFEGSLPHGQAGFSPQNDTVAGLTNLKDMVFKFTEVQDNALAGQGGAQDAAVLYGDWFVDVRVRQNIVDAINYLKTFTLGGNPPDWVSISIFKDIIPWSGQLLYEMLAKMQALLDAYSGVINEIKAFIDLLIRKINTLEEFLKYLISLLDFISKLSAGFYILSVPSTEGDVSEWGRLIDNAGGTPPPSGPGGYTGGVGLAYVAPDVGPFAAAFKLIF